MRLNNLEAVPKFLSVLSVLTLSAACGDEHLATVDASTTPDVTVTPDAGAEAAVAPTTIVLDAIGGKRAFVSLREAKTLDVATPDTSDTWDLSLTGYLLQTNGGPSGPGDGAAYGPITDMTFDAIASAGVVPHPSAWSTDGVASSFEGWYLYDKCPEGMHTLASRFHVYGIESGGRRWKLQIASYYGLVLGAPASARYTVRFAEVTANGNLSTVRLADLDASTAVYLDLASGAPVALTEAEAPASTAWDIAFRRSQLVANGGAAGVKGVRGVDLDAGRADVDADICAMTEASEETRFAAVAAADLGATSLKWVSGGIEGALRNDWYAYDPTSHRINPGTGIWIVRGGDGASFFRLAVTALEGASMSDAGRVTVKFAPIAAGM